MPASKDIIPCGSKPGRGGARAGGRLGQRRFRCARGEGPRQALACSLCLCGGGGRRRDHGRREHRGVAPAALAPARAQRRHRGRYQRQHPRSPVRHSDHGRPVWAPQTVSSRRRAGQRARRGRGRRRLRSADHIDGQPRRRGRRTRQHAALVPTLSAAGTRVGGEPDRPRGGGGISRRSCSRSTSRSTVRARARRAHR